MPTKGKKDLSKLFNEILDDISEKGLSSLDACKGRMSRSQFYVMLKDKDRMDMYARAREDRADLIFDEMISISDSKAKDVNRDRLRIDTRKWVLAKLNPKKYSDKIEMEHSGGVSVTGFNYIVPDGSNNKADDKAT